MAEGTFVAKDHNKVITLGLPLPSFIEHVTDVSEPTRMAIERACDYIQKYTDIEVFEVKKRGINVSANHNDIVNSMKGDWLLICGSDHIFAAHAIHTLWQAAQTEPFPKIISAVMPYRHPPHAPVCAHLNSVGELLYAYAPYKHYHPGMTMSGEIMKVDATGSGFTLYHRSVFDAVQMPWFDYAPLRFNDKNFYETLEDLPELLEDDMIDPDTAKQKADGIRRILGQSRRCIPFGPDFGFCMKAKDCGFQTYVHWGCEIQHSTFVPIHNGHFIAAMADPRSWFQYAIGGEEMSMDGLSKDIEMLKRLDFRGGLDADTTIKDYQETKKVKEVSV
jgi:hypothetical protein